MDAVAESGSGIKSPSQADYYFSRGRPPAVPEPFDHTIRAGGGALSHQYNLSYAPHFDMYEELRSRSQLRESKSDRLYEEGNRGPCSREAVSNQMTNQDRQTVPSMFFGTTHVSRMARSEKKSLSWRSRIVVNKPYHDQFRFPNRQYATEATSPRLPNILEVIIHQWPQSLISRLEPNLLDNHRAIYLASHPLIHDCSSPNPTQLNLMKRKDKKSVSWRHRLLELKPYSGPSRSFMYHRRPVSQQNETTLWLEAQLNSELFTHHVTQIPTRVNPHSKPKALTTDVMNALHEVELEPIFYEVPELPGIKFINHDTFERNRSNLAKIFEPESKHPCPDSSGKNELQPNTMTKGKEDLSSPIKFTQRLEVDQRTGRHRLSSRSSLSTVHARRTRTTKITSSIEDIDRAVHLKTTRNHRHTWNVSHCDALSCTAGPVNGSSRYRSLSLSPERCTIAWERKREVQGQQKEGGRKFNNCAEVAPNFKYRRRMDNDCHLMKRSCPTAAMRRYASNVM